MSFGFGGSGSNGGYSDESFEASFAEESIASDSAPPTPKLSPAQISLPIGSNTVLDAPLAGAPATVQAKDPPRGQQPSAAGHALRQELTVEVAQAPSVSVSPPSILTPVVTSTAAPATVVTPTAASSATVPTAGTASPPADVPADDRGQEQLAKQRREAVLRRKERNAVLVSAAAACRPRFTAPAIVVHYQLMIFASPQRSDAVRGPTSADATSLSSCARTSTKQPRGPTNCDAPVLPPDDPPASHQALVRHRTQAQPLHRAWQILPQRRRVPWPGRVTY